MNKTQALPCLYQHLCAATLELKHSADFPAQAAQIAAQGHKAGLPFSSLSVYLIDPDSRRGRNYFFHPSPAGCVDLSFDEGMAPLVAFIQQRPRMWQDPHSQKPLWYLTVPAPQGAVEIAAHRRQGFSPAQQDLLSGLAVPLQLLALRHRDLEDLERLGVQTSQSDAHLQALLNSTRALSGSDPDEVERKIIQTVTQSLSFDRAGLFLVDEKAALLRGAWGVDTTGEIVSISRTAFPLRRKHPEQLSEAALIALGELDYFLTQDLDGEGVRSLEGNIAANVAVPMRLGRRIVGVLACDNYFSRRPISPEQVPPLMLLANQAALALENARLHQNLRPVHERLQEELSASEQFLPNVRIPSPADQSCRFQDIVAESLSMRRLVRLARLAARTDNTVLLLGESGTGKDLFARAIHAASPRRDGPLVVVNSASLSSGLEDSELFGHVRGAFTSASRDSTGLVCAAQGGTLFLDEIGDLSPSSQAKLLRCLESGEVRRVGDTRVQKVDIRFIAATNRDLLQAVHKGAFREDLYYRLAVITLSIPPLRQRPEDIPPLVHCFLTRLAAEEGREQIDISPQTLDLLVRHPWPGNARQLDACLRQAALLSGDSLIEADYLSEEIHYPLQALPPEADLSLVELEKNRILEVLQRCNGDRRQAENILGISRATLQRRLKEYGFSS